MNPIRGRERSGTRRFLLSKAHLVLTCAILFLAFGCQRQEAGLPSEPDELALAGKGSCPQAARDLIASLFDPGIGGSLVEQCNNTQRMFFLGRTTPALDMLGDLVAKILLLEEEGKIVGDPDDVPPLIVELLKIVGLVGATDEIPAGASAETCVPPSPCMLHADDHFSGALIPENVLIFLNGVPYDGPFVVFSEPLPPDVSPFPDFVVGENAFPLFRHLGTLPEGLTFEEGPMSGLAPSVIEGEGGPVVAAVCVLDPPHSVAPDADDVDDLRLAHLVDGEVEITPLADATGLVDCTGVNESVPDGEVIGWRGAIDGLLGPATWFFSVSSLHASPGQLGGSISEFSAFGAILPDDGVPEGLADGFEDGLVWTANGFWNRTTGDGIVNQAVSTEHVFLAPDDVSGGALPAAPEGEWYIWYGVPADGNYIGTQAAEDPPGSGGSSTAPNSGAITSPAFSVPTSMINPMLNFDAWFEIESVDPAGFDQMVVSVIDVDAETVTELARLNPDLNPEGGEAHLPFTSSVTSGGFNTAPSFIEGFFFLSAFSGRTIRIVFTFSTGDALYNGFRGLIIDDVRVIEGPVIGGLTPAATRASSLAVNRAACGEPVCLDFPERGSR